MQKSPRVENDSDIIHKTIDGMANVNCNKKTTVQ